MSTTKDFVDEFCDIINTYGGRDKVMKVLCYAAKLISGHYSRQKPELAKRYAIASSRISGARATLRLIDDIPAIQHALEYGWGKEEENCILSSLGVLSNLVDLVYYPLEKICWLIDNNIIAVQSPKQWDNLNTVFWVLSVYLNLMGTITKVTRNQISFQRLDPKLLKESLRMRYSLRQHRLELISVIRLSMDLVHAVSYLPAGYLWGGKLTTKQIGAIGTISALIGIYQIFAKRRLQRALKEE